jgi:mono/diheme cytochrome c family protein
MNTKSKIKLSATFILALIFLLILNPVHAFKAGVTGYSNNPTCTSCHNTGTMPTVTLAGSNTVTPGSSNSYSFTITGGQQHSGGLNISATSGTLLLQAGDTSLKKLNSELTHVQPATANAGTVVWNFDWQAPATPGTYTIYAAGVSANGDNATSGDHAANDSLVITVGTSGPVPTAIILSPQTALVNSTVVFDGSTSTAPTGATITQFEWSVDGGDFAISTDVYQSSFTTAGRHTISLRVTDSNNDTALTFADIIIGDTTIPVVNHNGPYTGETATSINFDASTSTTDSTTTITNFIWDFGDGSAVVNGPNNATVSHTYATEGSYIVTIAAQDGNNMTGVASSTVTITTPTQPPTGQEIYDAKCLACHGPGGGGGSAKNIIGATQTIILDAVANVTEMNGIPLTNEEALLLEGYLAVTGTTGEEMYIGKCQICHGVAGVGDTAPAVIGATKLMILDKIVSVPSMNNIVLNSSQSQLIADYLGSATATTGSDHYAIKCAICHGATGAGISGVGPAVNGATQSMILDAITTKAIMDGITLSSGDAQLVADFLGTGGNNGQEVYVIKCAICHGDAGIGRPGYGPAVKGATDFMINGEVSNVTEMQGINLEGKSQLIADYLGSGGSTGQDFYTNKCFICHGSNGAGSSGSYDGGNIQGKSWTKYQSAITKKQEMNGILLSDPEAQDIDNYLNNGGP